MAKKQEAATNKYEKFTIVEIKRNEIHGADYNPRKITESAKKKLKRSLKEHGLVGETVLTSVTRQKKQETFSRKIGIGHPQICIENRNSSI